MASTDYVGQVQARMESLADGFMARAISLAQADMAVLDEQLEHARKKLRGEKGALVTASSALAPPSRAPLATITEASNSPRVEAAAAKPAPPAKTTKPSALVAVRSLDAPDSLVAGPGAGQLGVAYRAELAPAALPPVPLARPHAGPVPLRFPLVAVPANAATHRPAADW